MATGAVRVARSSGRACVGISARRANPRSHRAVRAVRIAPHSARGPVVGVVPERVKADVAGASISRVTAAPRLRFSFQDYILVDETSDARHEFLDGIILGMAGGTPERARLAAAVVAVLTRQLEGKPCAVFSEALRVRATKTGFAGYPDATVVCGALERDLENANTVTNPAVVVEVLSPSTEEYDTGDKLAHYHQIPSLSHVVFVAHDAIRIDVWTRTNGGWTKTSYGAGDRAQLAAIGCTIDVDRIFRDPLAS